MNNRPIIGLLLGDASGVGPEIVAKLIARGITESMCRPVIIGDIRTFEAGLRTFGGNAEYYPIRDIDEADWTKGYPILDTETRILNASHMGNSTATAELPV